MSEEKQPKKYRLVLMDEAGEVIGKPKNLRMDSGIAESEFAMQMKARELYRDYLYHVGKWNAENHAKLCKFWTGEPR